MLYGCGLRISEALNLKLNDVDFKQGTLFIRDTKFNKERIVPMAETLTRRCCLYADKVHGLNPLIRSSFPLRMVETTRPAQYTSCLEVYFGKPGFSIVERAQGFTMFAILMLLIV